MSRARVILVALLLAALAAGGVRAGADPRTAVYEQDGVRIEVTIRSQDFTWTVTNIDAPPIVGFEVSQHHMYNPEGPEGWDVEITADRLVARCDVHRFAIDRGAARTFGGRVSSSGAVLGFSPATITRADGTTLGFPSTWTPVAEPRSIVVLVAVTLIAVALFHVGIVRRLEARRSRLESRE